MHTIPITIPSEIQQTPSFSCAISFGFAITFRTSMKCDRTNCTNVIWTPLSPSSKKRKMAKKKTVWFQSKFKWMEKFLKIKSNKKLELCFEKKPGKYIPDKCARCLSLKLAGSMQWRSLDKNELVDPFWIFMIQRIVFMAEFKRKCRLCENVFGRLLEVINCWSLHYRGKKEHSAFPKSSMWKFRFQWFSQLFLASVGKMNPFVNEKLRIFK